MSSDVYGVLADGQVGTSDGALYTVGAGKQAIIKRMNFYNSNTTSELVKVGITPSGGTLRWLWGVTIPTLCSVIDPDILTLEAGDAINGDTTTGSKVDFVIVGDEITL